MHYLKIGGRSVLWQQHNIITMRKPNKRDQTEETRALKRLIKVLRRNFSNAEKKVEEANSRCRIMAAAKDVRMKMYHSVRIELQKERQTSFTEIRLLREQNYIITRANKSLQQKVHELEDELERMQDFVVKSLINSVGRGVFGHDESIFLPKCAAEVYRNIFVKIDGRTTNMQGLTNLTSNSEVYRRLKLNPNHCKITLRGRFLCPNENLGKVGHDVQLNVEYRQIQDSHLYPDFPFCH